MTPRCPRQPTTYTNVKVVTTRPSLLTGISEARCLHMARLRHLQGLVAAPAGMRGYVGREAGQCL